LGRRAGCLGSDHRIGDFDRLADLALDLVRRLVGLLDHGVDEGWEEVDRLQAEGARTFAEGPSLFALVVAVRGVALACAKRDTPLAADLGVAQLAIPVEAGIAVEVSLHLDPGWDAEVEILEGNIQLDDWRGQLVRDRIEAIRSSFEPLEGRGYLVGNGHVFAH